MTKYLHKWFSSRCSNSKKPPKRNAERAESSATSVGSSLQNSLALIIKLLLAENCRIPRLLLQSFDKKTLTSQKESVYHFSSFGFMLECDTDLQKNVGRIEHEDEHSPAQKLILGPQYFLDGFFKQKALHILIVPKIR